jgi:hypothetical protein
MPHWLSYTLIAYELMIIAWIELIARAPRIDD